MYEAGTKVYGFMKPVEGELALSTGKIFEVRVQASQGITDPTSAAKFLTGKLNEEYPELQVLWIKVCERHQTIDFQFRVEAAETLGFEPRVGRLFVATLLAWLPIILTLIGITAVAVSVWDIIAAVPIWVWVLLGTGVTLLLFGPALSRMITGRAPEKYRPIIVTR